MNPGAFGSTRGLQEPPQLCPIWMNFIRSCTLPRPGLSLSCPIPVLSCGSARTLLRTRTNHTTTPRSPVRRLSCGTQTHQKQCLVTACSFEDVLCLQEFHHLQRSQQRHRQRQRHRQLAGRGLRHSDELGQGDQEVSLQLRAMSQAKGQVRRRAAHLQSMSCEK